MHRSRLKKERRKIDIIDQQIFKLIKKIYEDRSLLNQMTMKQRQYSDKSVYENIDKQINKIINHEEN